MREAFVVLVSLFIGLGSGYIVPSGVSETSTVDPHSSNELGFNNSQITAATLENNKDLDEKELYIEVDNTQSNLSERAFVFINNKYKTPFTSHIFKSRFPDLTKSRHFQLFAPNIKEKVTAAARCAPKMCQYNKYPKNINENVERNDKLKTKLLPANDIVLLIPLLIKILSGDERGVERGRSNKFPIPDTKLTRKTYSKVSKSMRLNAIIPKNLSCGFPRPYQLHRTSFNKNKMFYNSQVVYLDRNLLSDSENKRDPLDEIIKETKLQHKGQGLEKNPALWDILIKKREKNGTTEPSEKP